MIVIKKSEAMKRLAGKKYEVLKFDRGNYRHDIELAGYFVPDIPDAFCVWPERRRDQNGPKQVLRYASLDPAEIDKMQDETVDFVGRLINR